MYNSNRKKNVEKALYIFLLTKLKMLREKLRPE